MKFAGLLAPLALFGAVQAWDNCCLSDEDAQSIADRSIIFLSHEDVALANTTAQGLFASDIQEFGDSINSLRGDPLGTQVEDGSAQYIEETLSTPPIPVIKTLTIIHDCSRMLWQWEFQGIGTGEYRVRGVTIIGVEFYDDGKGGCAYKVNNQYVEFNSLAWAADSGYTITPPTTGPFAASSSGS